MSHRSNPRHGWRRAALFALATLLMSGSAHAYTVLTLDGGRTMMRWPTSSMTYEVNATLVPYLTDDVAAMHQVMQNWQDVECANIAVANLGETSSQGAAYPFGGFDGVNRVIYVEGQNWRPEDSQALAITALSYAAGGGTRIAEADIAFNGNYQWQVGGGANGINFLPTALHEAGHYFGIQHSELPQSIMYFSENGQPPILTPDDSEALCFLYPADIGGHTCDDDDQCPLVEGTDQLGRTIRIGQMRCVDNLCQLGDEPIKRAFGEPCTDSTQCEDELECQASGAEQLCTRDCTLSNDDCPFAYQCVTQTFNTEQGVCWPEGSGDVELGGPCDFSSQCIDGLCVADPREDSEAGLCTRFCSDDIPDDCPVDTLCAPIAIPGRLACLPTGDGPPGTPCESFIDCQGGRCLTDPSGAFCRAPCDADEINSACDEGTACLRTVYGDACLNSGALPVGEACTGSFDCTSLLCLASTGGVNLCSQQCDGDNPCDANFECQFFGVGQEFCMPPAQPPEDIGGGDADASAPPDVSADTAAPADTRSGAEMVVEPSTRDGEEDDCACASVRRAPAATGSTPLATLFTLLAAFVALTTRRRARPQSPERIQ